MSSTGVLVVSNIKQFSKTLRAVVERYICDVLYIHLNIPIGKAEPIPCWGRLMSQLYNDSQLILNGKDMRILVSPMKGHVLQLNATDRVFCDSDRPPSLQNLLGTALVDPLCISEQSDASSDILDFQNLDQPSKTYRTVVLGGTFDRIHVGHKIFLTQAVLRARHKLVVGVTTELLTGSKTLAELILPVERRIKDVREFLMTIDATLQYQVEPINDPFGPTQSDPDMDLIVVSAETLRGGHKVNEVRSKNNLKPLEIFCIEMVESSVSEGPKETKVSSSNTRMDILGTRLRQPEARPHLPKQPYIIGLTGGIASGKSKMAERFQRMGATVLNCDLIAHDIYAPGQVCYDKVVGHFGQAIVDSSNNSFIDRQKLGAIVFSNPQKLHELNNIVWPELMLEVKRRISKLQLDKSKTNVVIIEAAVLLMAGWETECHEVWSMIIPNDIAVQRIMERNGLGEEEARKRRGTQWQNHAVVNKSHIVFSSQWDEAFTQQQAERAWHILLNELELEKNTINSML